jgi:type II secretory pathway component PulF
MLPLHQQQQQQCLRLPLHHSWVQQLQQRFAEHLSLLTHSSTLLPLLLLLLLLLLPPC